VQPGTIMRVSGEGMPHVGSPFDRGDLYFRISVIFPVLPLPRDALSIDRVPSHRRERGLATSSKLNQWDALLFRIPLERIKSRLSLHFSRPVSHRALSGPTKCPDAVGSMLVSRSRLLTGSEQVKEKQLVQQS